MILDVNVLLYAIDSQSRAHEKCRLFIESALNGRARVGFPWPTILAFLRIATHPRVMTEPLSIDAAWSFIDDWLAAPVSWVPLPTAKHLATIRELTTKNALTGNLIPDAHLAAIALEHGVALVSCDTDFARFAGLTWINPLTAP